MIVFFCNPESREAGEGALRAYNIFGAYALRLRLNNRAPSLRSGFQKEGA